MSTFNRVTYEVEKDADRAYKAGVDLTDEGISGLRDLDKRYNDMIASGGLTPELRRQFDVARGYLSDQYVRSGRSLKAALAQRRMQSGGQLTAGAVAELEKEGSIARDEKYFDSSNELAGQQAQLGYTATRDWYSSLENIRTTMTNTGLTREQQARLARLQVAALRLNNKQITLGALTSLFRGVTGAAAGGG